MKKLGAYLFIFLAIAVKSNGQDRFVLEGTIGKYPVIMKIEKGAATYFYKNRKQDIELEGENANPRKLFFKREIYDSKLEKDVMSESLSIQMTGNGSSAGWKGSWKNRKGISLPVSLKSIDTTKYDFSQVPEIYFDNNEDRIFTKTRLSGLNFVKDSVTMSGLYQLQWLHESLSGTQLLEIKNGFAPNILQKINKILREKNFDHINDFFTCTTRGDWEPEYTATIHEYFISPQYVSIQVTEAFDCGGTHPDAGDFSFTIDAVTGKEIKDLNDLFFFDKNGKASEPDDRARAIVSIMQKLYPAEMKKPVSEDDCDYSDPYPWRFPAWYFTKKGLYLAPTFPHAMMPCNFAEFPVIPYTVLKQYERKK